MRILLPLLLVAAASFAMTPTASACHPDPALDTGVEADLSAAPYYVVPYAWYGGCPHKLTLCLQVWRESNGQTGLQTGGSNPDQLVVLVCPNP